MMNPLKTLLFLPCIALAGDYCGQAVTLDTLRGATMRYAYSPSASTQENPVALVLLPGGGGHLDLDHAGCPRKLMGNSLVRSAPLFRELGFHTALVDAPSDMAGEDGLAGFRLSSEHAADLGRVIADLRSRNGARTVWLIGTSRGSISAANAAASLTGPAAADGAVLTSALMVGQSGARKAYVAQSVFDVPLEQLSIPLLIVGHAADSCTRSPAQLMPGIAERAGSARKQVVTVTGGPGNAAGGLAACEGKSPHGFLNQETEVAAGIARFIRGGRY